MWYFELFHFSQIGNVDLRVADNQNLQFRFLVTTTLHPYGFAQTQVLLFISIWNH